MTYETIMAGFGGQGLLFSGKVLAHAALIELKYVKAGDPAPTPDQLADIQAKAIEQLDRYSADPALAAEWRLKPMQNAQCTMHNGEAGQLSREAALRPQCGHLCGEAALTGDCAPGAVSLHRLVLVFKGGDCLLREEV